MIMATQHNSRNQRGVSMLFALCALAVLTLGAVALVRSIDTGMLVLGNLGFKKDAVAAGSVATEAAITWLQNNNANDGLDVDKEDLGYYATSPSNLDPTGATLAMATSTVVLPDWNGDGCKDIVTKSLVCRATRDAPVNGDNTVRYLITRLCQNPGKNDGGNNCVVPVTAQAGDSSQRGALKPGGRFNNFSSGTAYRILTRTVGTRGTVAYTETLVHF
jgi:type IV pilus assembly protein PilX